MITQGEAFALQRALQDVEFRRGFVAFLDKEVLGANELCCTAMNQDPAKIERALGYAAQASICSEMLNRLEEFTRDQISRA